MTLTPALHKALLAGVSRAPIATDSAGATLQDLLANVPQQLRLWHAVAASDLWHRAGYQPAPAEPQPASPDAPTCPRAAESVLSQILRGIHGDQMDGWLALARQHGYTLPHSALVALLEQGMTRPGLRATIKPLLGERGRWLAAQHPQWSEKYAAINEEAPANDWELGSLPQRVEALRAMRNRDPVTALAALESGWKQEPADSRIALLRCLSTSLSLHDEDFLELALDDKRKEVRTTAQQLLATLPGSKLAARCQARLAALMTIERKSGLVARLGSMLGGGLPELKLELPQLCDPAMRRDGIGIEKYHGLGEKAGWLQDMVRSVPPSYWTQTWQLTPDVVIRLFAQNEFHVALLTGLAQAAANAIAVAPDADSIDWFITLMTQAHMENLNLAGLLLSDMDKLPAPDQERIALLWISQQDRVPHAYNYAMEWAERRFNSSGEQLPLELSQLMLASEQRRMRALAQPSYITRHHFATLGKVLDTGVITTAQAGWPPGDWQHWPEWRQLVDDTMDRLHFRHTMQASFLENDA